MPSRDEKSKLNYLEEESNDNFYLTTNVSSNTIFYKDNAFEMMSLTNGEDNKKELEKLKGANK